MAIATLTVDLVARLGKMEQELNRATQLSEKAAKRIDESFAVLKSSLGTVFAGVTVGSAWQAFIGDTAKLGEEISRLSQVSNASVEEFQRMAYGAKSAGVEQDKFADILKDVNDKFGEFSITGGGELKDFFDTVAKKAGVTAEAFKNLSGPQALQLYYNTLEKAGVSQQQATFFMEALGNDASKLIPLLKNGGAGFKKMADEAERLGAVMDAKAIASAKEFEANMQRLNRQFSAFKVSVGNEMIPGLNEIMEFTRRAQKELGAFSGTLVGLLGGSGAKLLGLDLDELKRAETEVAETFAKLAKARQDLFDQKQLKEKGLGIGFVVDNNIKNAEEEIAKQKQALKEAIKARDDISKARKVERDAAKEPAGGPPPGFSGGSKPPKAKAARPEDPFGDWLKDLEARVKPAEDALKKFRDIQLDVAVAGAELTTSQRAFYDLVNSPEWQAMSEPWQDLIRAEAELASVAEQAAVHQQRLNELLGATDSAQLEKTRADMQILADAVEAGRISMEQFEEAATKALGNVAVTGKDQFEELLDAINGWGREASGEIARVVLDGNASLKTLGSVFDTIAQKMVAMALQQQLIDPLMKGVSGAIGGGGSGGGFDFSKLMAMIPSFDVGTPYVPQTGLALIHKGERIVTAKDNAAGKFGVGNIHMNFNMQGPVDGRTAAQIQTAAASGLQRALRRNG